MAISVNLDKGLDKAFENVSIDELLKAPPSALAGLTEKHDQVLAVAFGVKTRGALGSNKSFAGSPTAARLKPRPGTRTRSQPGRCKAADLSSSNVVLRRGK